MSKMNMNLNLDGIESMADLYKGGKIKSAVKGGFDGFFMGWPQELSAAISAGGFDNERYPEELRKQETEHSELKKAFPKEYMGGQAVGAVINPATMIGGSTIFRGAMQAVKNAPAFIRWLTGAATLGGEGAVIGGIEGAGRSEPGERLDGAEFGAKLGLILGVGGSGAGAVIGQGVKYANKLRKWFTQNNLEGLGRRAMDELASYAAKEGRTVDELLIEVVQNKIPILEISPSMRQLASLVQQRSGDARDLLEKSVIRRADETTRTLKDETQTRLARNPSLEFDAFKSNNQMRTTPTGSVDPNNMESTIRLLNNDITNYVNKAYDNAFGATFSKAGVGVPKANEGVRREMTLSVELINRLANNLNDAVKLQTLNKTPLITINKQGEILYSRQPTLKEAEIIRKTIADEAQPALGQKRNEIQTGFKNREMALKEQLNKQSPDLKVARDTSALGMLAQEAFDSTKNMFGKRDYDKFLDEYALKVAKAGEKYGEQGEKLVKQYYRYGLQNELNKNLAKTNKGTFIKALNDPDSKEYKLITTLYPSGGLDRLMSSLGKAQGALDAKGKILAYSAGKDIGNINALDQTVNEMRNTAQAIRSANVSSLAIDKVAGAVKSIFGTKYGMSQAQFKLMAQFLTERRPEVAKKLLEGKFRGVPEGSELDRLAKYMVGGGAATTTVGTGVANDMRNQRPQ